MKLPRGYDYSEDKKQYRLRFTFEGQRHSVYGHTISECEDKKTQKVENLKNRLHIDNQRITLEKYHELWLSEIEERDTASTLYEYSKSWKHLNKYLGKNKIARIEKSHVLNMRERMKKDGCTPDTINRAVRLLKQIMKAAVTDRVILFNPCDGVKNLKSEKAKAVQTNHKALTMEETKLFLESAGGCHYCLLFKFLLNTGLRIGEALALTWFDIDFDKKVFHVSKTVARCEDGWYVSDNPKTASGNRTIDLTAETESILHQQKEQNMVLFGRCRQQPYIFPSASGDLTNYNNVNNCISNIIKRIRETENPMFPKFTVHAFRDTFATRCIEQHMEPLELKALMGHSDIRITLNVYAQVTPDTRKEALSKIRFA